MNHKIEVYNKIKFEELPTSLVNGYSKIMRECVHSICLKKWPQTFGGFWPNPLDKMDRNELYFNVITEIISQEDLP